jgi:signal transduction histidine kinase/CheY-like chemotaxis protein
VIGKTDADIMDPAVLPELETMKHGVIASGRAARREVAVALPGGPLEYYDLYAEPLRGRDGCISGITCVAVDYTERHALEDALRGMSEHLEQRVQEEAAKREAAQSTLAHVLRMEALGRLAGGIAHDFNNVLTAVQGGAALIDRYAEDVGRVRRLAGMIVDASKRGAQITHRLRTFSRRADLSVEPVEVVFLLESIQDILSHTLGARIAVSMHAGPRLPPLLADKGQLETVLVNLATNASDAMQGEGTIQLTAALDVVTPDNGSASPAKLAPGAYVRLAVTDNGSGMAPEVLARATEPFFTTKAEGLGTGLGLAMAQGFAEQSAGGLHIESQPGAGTTVTLWLPVAAAPCTAEPVPDAASGPAVKPADARLMMVDDNLIVLETLAQQLEAKGYAVLRAASGAEALSHLRAGETVDLVITDLSMPGMDGLALVQEVRQLLPEMPAIIVTGFATSATEEAASRQIGGRFMLLRKPVLGQVLAGRVADLLAGASTITA